MRLPAVKVGITQKETTLSSNTKQTRLIPVTQWNKHHAWPPLGGLRHLVFKADEKGFAHVVKRAGRTVLIDERAFFEWVEEQNALSQLGKATPPGDRAVSDEDEDWQKLLTARDSLEQQVVALRRGTDG